MKTLVFAFAAAFGAIVCAAVPPTLDRAYTQQQMGSSMMPLVITVGIPLVVSMIVSALAPKSMRVLALWIALGSLGYFLGDAYVIFSDKGDHHTLWPIELVVLTGFVCGSLTFGAFVGNTLVKARRR